VGDEGCRENIYSIDMGGVTRSEEQGGDSKLWRKIKTMLRCGKEVFNGFALRRGVAVNV